MDDNLKQALEALRNAETMFNLAAADNPELIDAAIYQVNAAQLRVSNILRQIRAKAS